MTSRLWSLYLRNLAIIEKFGLATLFLLLPVIACRKTIAQSLFHPPRSCAAFNELVLNATSTIAYNRGVLAINYGDHGFIRRGLGGTVFGWLRNAPLSTCVDALFWFHLFSAVWLAIPLILLVRRVAAADRQYGAWLGLLLVGSPQLYWAWGGDFGRTDMLAIGFVAWAALAMLDGHLLAAATAILIGTLVHENVAIFGVPLLMALWLDPTASKARRQAILPAALLVVGLGAIILGQAVFTTAGPREIIDAILDSQPPSRLRDLAAYMTAEGTRSIVTSWCLSFGRRATPLFLICGFLLVPIYAWLLCVRPHEARRYALATALPLIVVSLIAIDYGRWFMFATAGGWLFAAATATTSPRTPFTISTAGWRIAALAVLFAMRPTSVQAPNPFVETVAAQIWGKKATLLKETDECDPHWRTSLAPVAASPIADGHR